MGVRMGLDVENRLLQATSTLAECQITGIFRVNSAWSFLNRLIKKVSIGISLSSG